jgi:Tol biopolymer transport system component
MKRTVWLIAALLLSACAAPAAQPDTPTPAPSPTAGPTALPPTAGPTATRLPMLTPASGAARMVVSGPPGLTGDIVFAFGDGPVWLTSATNGWYTVQLVPKPADAVAITPAWSPDGNQVSFTLRSTQPAEGGRLPPADVYAIGVDGQNLRRLITPEQPGEVNQDAMWMPDGSGILFTSSAVLVDASGLVTGFKLGIDRAGPNGEGRTTLIPTAVAPGISPDSRRLVYLRPSVDGLRQGLFIADIDGNNERQLVPDTRFLGIVWPRFTPDGQHITFVASEKYWPTPTPKAPGIVERQLDLFVDGVAEAHFGPFEVWRIDPDGQNLQQMTNLGYDQPAIAWAPDGQGIALVSPEGFYVASPDGATLTRATQQGGHGGVDWRP